MTLKITNNQYVRLS